MGSHRRRLTRTGNAIGVWLHRVARGRLELGSLEDEAEKKEQEKEAGELKDLTERTKKALAERVKEVRVTLRLTESPACLVADEHDLSANLQRMLKAAGQKAPAAKPIMELNPRHPLVQRLNQVIVEALNQADVRERFLNALLQKIAHLRIAG